MNKLILLALLVVFVFTQSDVVVVDNNEIESAQNTEAEAYQIKDGVYILSENTFKNALEEFDYVLVKFFAPWCGHCKHLTPVWIEVAKALQQGSSLAKIAEVDCTVHQNVCQQKGIRGYPTMLWFEKGKDASEKYAGARSTEAFVSWINQKTNPNTQNVADL